MVTVDKSHPNRAFGDGLDGMIDNDHCTIYNFEISTKRSDK